jgi:hypothetical protein
MAKNVVKHREMRLDSRGTNGVGSKVVVLDLWGNSYSVLTKVEAAHLAHWMNTVAVPFLRDFAEKAE